MPSCCCRAASAKNSGMLGGGLSGLSCHQSLWYQGAFHGEVVVIATSLGDFMECLALFPLRGWGADVGSVETFSPGLVLGGSREERRKGSRLMLR